MFMASVIMQNNSVIMHYYPMSIHLQVNKGVTQVDLLSYANELEAQTDLMVRGTYNKTPPQNQHGSNHPHNVFSVYQLQGTCILQLHFTPRSGGDPTRPGSNGMEVQI